MPSERNQRTGGCRHGLRAPPGEPDPERAATSERLADVCVEAGLVSRDDVSKLGPGKIIRKYASTALRSLRSPPPCASDAALDCRHLHTRAVWSAAYRCESFTPLQAVLDALAPAQRAGLSIERLLRLRPPEEAT